MCFHQYRLYGLKVGVVGKSINTNILNSSFIFLVFQLCETIM